MVTRAGSPIHAKELVSFARAPMLLTPRWEYDIAEDLIRLNEETQSSDVYAIRIQLHNGIKGGRICMQIPSSQRQSSSRPIFPP